MTRTSNPAGWIRLTLHMSGESLYIRADVITAVHTEVTTAGVAYSLVDTDSDQWAFRESADYIMEEISGAPT